MDFIQCSSVNNNVEAAKLTLTNCKISNVYINGYGTACLGTNDIKIVNSDIGTIAATRTETQPTGNITFQADTPPHAIAFKKLDPPAPVTTAPVTTAPVTTDTTSGSAEAPKTGDVQMILTVVTLSVLALGIVVTKKSTVK